MQNTDTVESLHDKITTRLSCLEMLARAFNRSVELSETTELQRRYGDVTSSLLSDYYARGDERTVEKYRNAITSHNFVNRTDHLFLSLRRYWDQHHAEHREIVIPNIQNEAAEICRNDFEQPAILNNLGEIVRLLQEKYRAQILVFPMRIMPENTCADCASRTTYDPTISCATCDQCGTLTYMPGTVLDDIDIFNRLYAKHKRYDANRHCEKWIKQIQASEEIPSPAFDDVVGKLDHRARIEYTRDGRLRSMRNMKCSQVRQWLKDFHLTIKWNDHVPLLRRAVTALHGEPVCPPQLTKAEEGEVLADFSTDMEVYEELTQREDIKELIERDSLKNRPYYPYGLLKVLCRQLRGDPRLIGLIECIHFQRPTTIIKNDRIYSLICAERGIKFEPTDRAMLLNGSHCITKKISKKL